jgi:hypothetical protein
MDFDGNKRSLMGIFWELDENKRILIVYFMRIFLELDEKKRILMGTRGI